MDKIAILPGVLAAILILKGYDSRKLFIYYFLPVLTLIPTYFETKLVQGIPEMAFWSSALLPVFALWLVSERSEGYFFSWLDVIVIVHVLMIFYAQWEATGYKDAQKILFREILQRLMPYLMVKAIASDPERREQTLKVIVYLAAGIAVMMAVEFKFYYNIFDNILRRFWPFSVPWGGVMARYGLKRAAGPFSHPISAGYYYAMIWPLAFWLWRTKRIKNYWLGLAVTGLTLVGLVTSISRAPLAGGVLALAIIWFGWNKYKTILTGLIFFVMTVFITVFVPMFVDYVSVDRAHAKTQDQENAAYRKEMLDNYFEVIAEKPYWGYGRYTFPVVNRQVSIDNEYLFIALTSGLVPLAFYLLILGWVLVRAIRFALKRGYADLQAQLMWCLVAGWITAIFTQATVYAGSQTLHYLYMLAGLTEAIYAWPGSEIKQDTEIESVNEYQFSRTL
jgi:hypothetical protein